MDAKKIMLIMASLAAIVVMSLVSVAYDNHVRWNNQLDECVYYYEKGEGIISHCFVAESNCGDQTYGRDEYKTINPVECSATPLNPKNQDSASECAEFTEGDLIVLKYQGNDPDAEIGPAGKLIYGFETPFDEGGAWQTARGDAGEYESTVSVNDGEFTDTAEVCFTVLKGNHAPSLTIGDATVNEGEALLLKPSCTDEDGDAVRLAFSGDMTTASWTPTFDDAGTYEVVITCTDTEGESDRETITVTVNNVDRKPSLTGVEDVTVFEGETVSLNPRCVDPEGSKTTITYSGDMDTNKWATTYADSGEYSVTVTCVDETSNSVSEEVGVTVVDRNRPPTITAMVVAG